MHINLLLYHDKYKFLYHPSCSADTYTINQMIISGFSKHYYNRYGCVTSVNHLQVLLYLSITVPTENIMVVTFPIEFATGSSSIFITAWCYITSSHVTSFLLKQWYWIILILIFVLRKNADRMQIKKEGYKHYSLFER